MLKANKSVLTRRANAWWEVRENAAVSIAPTPTTRSELKFNATASTLRVLSPEVEKTQRIRAELNFAGFSCRVDKGR